MIGHELGNRYEIITRIGGGGMALVYKGLDLLLNRHVAIKVLRQQFVHDEEFIHRFRREAQSAASLSHPNVVSIYDVGQEGDTHYIVMEYVEGHNLNEIIKEKAPMQVEEAVHIASQICDALDHAHHNEIIHRDIKPHNILIGKNGRVKVTDFGIARAVTSSTITQTGSVVGSVHYFSPEHAKGVATGTKSDLYSLGIVLYQMLTGQLPFLGESPISVALKHLQDEFEEPRKVNKLIPQSVENIILKSMRKNPQERYQSALEMLRDLETCLSPDRLHEAKVTFDDDADADADDQKTRVVPAIRPEQKTAKPGASASREPKKESLKQEREEEEPKNNRPWFKPVVWIGSTLLVLGLMFGLVMYVLSQVVVPEVTMPKLINLTEEEAVKQLHELGLEVEDPIIREPKEGFDKGIVFDQSKPENTKVKKGSAVIISVSEGTPQFKMPDLSGQKFADAVRMLENENIDASQIKQEEGYDDEMESGLIFKQSPADGEMVDPKSVQITLTVSKGSETFKMPNLIGKTESEAIAIIEKNDLKLAKESGGIMREPSYFQKGEVFKQWPHEPGESVSKGTEIMIYVSSGYPPEAIVYDFNIPVSPKEVGTESKIRLTYTDARGENIEWGTQNITNPQIFSVELVLAPNKDGAVSVFRDGEFLDTYPVSYMEAKTGTVNVPQPDIPPTDAFYEEEQHQEGEESEQQFTD